MDPIARCFRLIAEGMLFNVMVPVFPVIGWIGMLLVLAAKTWKHKEPDRDWKWLLLPLIAPFLMLVWGVSLSYFTSTGQMQQISVYVLLSLMVAFMAVSMFVCHLFRKSLMLAGGATMFNTWLTMIAMAGSTSATVGVL